MHKYSLKNLAPLKTNNNPISTKISYGMQLPHL